MESRASLLNHAHLGPHNKELKRCVIACNFIHIASGLFLFVHKKIQIY